MYIHACMYVHACMHVSFFPLIFLWCTLSETYAAAKVYAAETKMEFTTLMIRGGKTGRMEARRGRFFPKKKNQKPFLRRTWPQRYRQQT
jgi:hypothetical protein